LADTAQQLGDTKPPCSITEKTYNKQYHKEYNINAVSYSDLRRNLKDYLDRVHNDNETLIVARKDNQNVVMISIDEYNNLIETAHLHSTEANVRHLAESIRQAKEGKAKPHNLIEP